MPNHRHSSSIPIVRLAAQLPPLPLSDLPSHNTTVIPYRDNPEDEEDDTQPLLQPEQESESLPQSLSSTLPTIECKPPDYEPMYDYLRSQHRRPPALILPNSYLSSTPLSHLHQTSHPHPHTHHIHLPNEPYRDEPFVITINPDSSSVPAYTDTDLPNGEQTQPPPPSYEASEQERSEMREQDMRRGMMDMATGMGEEDGRQAEEVCKFLVAMVLIALTVGAVGMAFQWGR